MKSYNKIILLLLVLGIVLGVYAAKVMYDNKKEESKADTIELFKLDKSNIDEIKIENSKESFSIKNNNGSYDVLNVNYKMDKSAIEDIVNMISNVEAIRLISENKEDFKRYGLDNPNGQCIVNLKDGTSRKLLLGDAAPGGSSYYAEYEGKVYTISDTTGKLLLKRLEDLRDKQLSLANDNVSGIKILTAGNNVELKLEDENRWVISQPYGNGVSVDYDKVYIIIDALKNIYIENFVEDNCKDFSKYGLNKPSKEVIVIEGNNQKSMIFGNMVGNESIYFKVSDNNSVYMMSMEDYKKFDVKAFDIISACPVNPLVANINEMTVISGNEKYIFTVEKQNIDSKDSKDNSSEVKLKYKLNGKEMKEEDFLSIYNKYCTIVVDSQIKKVIKNDTESFNKPEVVIKFKLNKGLEKNINIEFIPYNEQFYKMLINGKGDFAISKSQINEFINAIR
ncbi:protein of unknown function [Caloramator quimbayensis]|uniref:DUF4340 domain-containing protein n=1 Tax=Caloramator quimbayensis TaxID=1147123 RepID=A0A1T4YF07_9CLOT|nr:DUF4340 domain-containing protein [Caloramator quimbayensis]SKB00417.1 protein of unknown function [Caloramator quimbayensis]